MLRRFFEDLAINFVRICHADNPQFTHDLLTGKVEDFDDLTPLEIAANANFKSFILIEPVQSLLRKVWTTDIQRYSKWRYFPVSFFRILEFNHPLIIQPGCIIFSD